MNYPYPRGLGTSTPIPPAPPATYEHFSVGTSNGGYSVVTDTTFIARETVITPQGLGVNGASTGKYLAVYYLTPAAPDPFLGFWLGSSPTLPPSGDTTPNLGIDAGPFFPSWGCVFEFAQNTGQGPSGSGTYLAVVNQDFGESGIVGPITAIPAVAAVATDITDGKQYLAYGPSMAALTWQIGNPFTGTGGKSLHVGDTYYPAVAVLSAQASIVANWGSGPLPGFVGAWVPPGYQGWP